MRRLDLLNAARVPTECALHATLAKSAQGFVALDGAMVVTTDVLRHTGTHVNTLCREASKWARLEHEGLPLRAALDALVASIDPARREQVVTICVSLRVKAKQEY